MIYVFCQCVLQEVLFVVVMLFVFDMEVDDVLLCFEFVVDFWCMCVELVVVCWLGFVIWFVELGVGLVVFDVQFVCWLKKLFVVLCWDGVVELDEVVEVVVVECFVEVVWMWVVECDVIDVLLCVVQFVLN